MPPVSAGEVIGRPGELLAAKIPGVKPLCPPSRIVAGSRGCARSPLRRKVREISITPANTRRWSWPRQQVWGRRMLCA